MPAEWGGGGLPRAVGVAIQEMITSASMAFSLCPLLTQAGIEALAVHGTPEQHNTYLTKLVTGQWAGTMQLTEPQAGSDVGALTTRAVREDDGTYRLFGTKIFITWGDHDMTDNIVHLVLARTPGATPGTKGISLFLVPKFLVDPDGNIGERNDVKVVSLEHKMGIHASPTCVISFGEEGEGALGYLIGEEQQGMRLMFTMMNDARLGVGIEGVAIAERAYQQALSFSQERRQGRATGLDRKLVDHRAPRRTEGAPHPEVADRGDAGSSVPRGVAARRGRPPSQPSRSPTAAPRGATCSPRWPRRGAPTSGSTSPL